MSATASEPGHHIASGALRLEAQWLLPAAPLALVTLSHPHPLYGGDMHNPLIDWLFRALPERAIGVLRYNFRGAGRSTGEFDGGVGEVDDATAAFAATAELAPDLPLVSVGWSFGSVVSLAADHERLAGWIAVAPPLGAGLGGSGEPHAATDARPKLLLVPEHDQFCPPDRAAAATQGWANTDLVVLAGTDHSIAGRADDVVDAAQTMVESVLPQ